MNDGILEPYFGVGESCQGMGEYVNEELTPDTCVHADDPNPVEGTTNHCTVNYLGGNLALTAAHCVCEFTDSKYPIMVRWGTVKSRVRDPLSRLHPGRLCHNAQSAAEGQHDVGLLVLEAYDGPVATNPSLNNTTALPFRKGIKRMRLVGVGDFLASLLATPSPIPSPIMVAGYGATDPGTAYGAGVLRTAEIKRSRFFFDVEGAFMLDHDDEAVLLKGDSGAPAMFVDGAGPVIFAINSGVNEHLQNGMVPLWDAYPYDPAAPPQAMPNGKWLKQVLAEIDRDGDFVTDDIDNCNPLVHCPDDWSKCANPDQHDGDNDGLGNECDPCAKDSSNIDTDGDGIGDACDLCPEDPNPTVDSDGDGYGDICDECPSSPAQYGEWCNVDTDCTDLEGVAHACRNHRCNKQVSDDLDCDGVINSLDRCPMTPDPGQGDVDGDGIGDACDCSSGIQVLPSCQSNADCSPLELLGAPKNYCVEGWSDVEGRHCAQLPDRDDDGVKELCGDNCPGLGNPDQADSDLDGIGDPCDDTPCRGVDADGDKFIDEGTCVSNSAFCVEWCADLDKIDNCNGVPNDQKNCNARSEKVHDGKRLGDACDPVPCPSFEVRESAMQSVPLPPKHWHDDEGGIWGSTGTRYFTVASNLDLRPLGSKQAPAPFNDTSPQAKASAVVNVLKTSVRYCNEKVVAPERCDRKEWVADKFLTIPNAQAEEAPLDPWHRVTLRRGATTILPDNYLFNVKYGADAIVVGWDWQADFDLWLSTSHQWGTKAGLTFPTSAGDAAGRFWVHGDTAIGTTDLTTFRTGRHPRASQPSLAAEQLVNHYQPTGGLSAKDHWTPPTKVGQFVDPGKMYREPFRLIPPYRERWSDDPRPPLAVAEVGFGINPGDANILIETKLDDRLIGVLTREGSLQGVGENLGAALVESLGNGGRWVSQAEPTSRLGRAASMPEGVLLADAGDRLVDRAWLVDGKLLTDRDTGGCGRRFCETIGAASARQAAPAPVAQGGPAPRREFASVYSRTLGRLFVIGGERLSDGEAAGDIWWQDPIGGVWVKLATSYQPRHVVAATFSHGDRKLWVLDELHQGWPVARLVRIDPDTGVAEQVAAWPRLGLFDAHWLSVDVDGSILLSGSSSSRRRHVIARIDADQAPRVDLIRHGDGPLFAEPYADENGYWIITSGKNGALRVDHRPSLDGKKGWAWHQVGQCF